MSPINVLIARKTEDEYLRQMRAVSPEIKIIDGSELVEAEAKGDFSSSAKLDKLLAEMEVIYGMATPRNALARAPKLKWFHTMYAGVDRILNDEIIRSSVVITNGKGIHDTPCAEVALEMMLMLDKNAPYYFLQKMEKRWEKLPPRILRNKTVGIVGLGSIGTEIARLSKAFRMRVIGVRRSATHVTKTRYADAVYPPEQICEMLAQCDFVAMALPFTPETEKLMGEKEFRAMKPTAFIVNIGRGRTMDEEALVRALEEKRIAGAGLDVFAVEPLPKESKLWTLPNVVYSPRMSGGGEDIGLISTEQFCENLKRYISGKKLLNRVDKKRGY